MNWQDTDVRSAREQSDGLDLTMSRRPRMGVTSGVPCALADPLADPPLGPWAIDQAGALNCLTIGDRAGTA